MRTSTLITGALLVTCAGLHAGSDGPGAARDAQAAAAYDQLKTLVGAWDANTASGPVHVSYELVAGGTALLERETSANMPPMLTVYHRDGDRLLLTHYCMAGNQPRMEARSYDPARGELIFEFVDGTNLASPDAGHMHSVAVRFIDRDHLLTEWTFFEGGRSKMTEAARYTRVR